MTGGVQRARDLVAFGAQDRLEAIRRDEVALVSADAASRRHGIAGGILGRRVVRHRAVARIARHVVRHIERAVDVAQRRGERRGAADLDVVMALAAVGDLRVRQRRRVAVTRGALRLAAVDRGPDRSLRGTSGERGAVAVAIATLGAAPRRSACELAER